MLRRHSFCGSFDVSQLPPECLDQQSAGLEAALRDLNIVALVLKQGGLLGDDLEIGIDAILVADVEEIKRLRRRCGGVMLLAGFDLEVVQRVQVVLDLTDRARV